MIRAGYLKPGDRLVYPLKGERASAQITADGKIRLDDGREFESPSVAGKEAHHQKHKPRGWTDWILADDPRQRTLADLRDQFIESRAQDDARA